MLPAPADSLAAEPELVERIAASYAKAIEAQRDAPPAYQLSAEWLPIIRKEKEDFLSAFEAGNQVRISRLLESCFRNSGSAGLVDYGRYEVLVTAPFWRKAQFINNILHDFNAWTRLCGKPPMSLSCPRYGNTWGLTIDGALILQTACRHHYWAERCLDIVRDNPHPVIAEIGGGAGTFAYYLRAGRPAHTYISFDLPDTLALASFYLMHAFPHAKVALWGEKHPKAVLESPLEWDFILYPNFALKLLPDRSTDIVTNTRSLSEMDYETVAEYLGQVTRACKGYFVHENSTEPSGIYHVEVPSQSFPVDSRDFKLLAKSMSPWRSGSGRYREHVFERCQ
jgi:hypothetical protein